MKSIRSHCAVLALALQLVALPAVVQAQFNYTNNGDGTITITGYTGLGGAVTIPSTIYGLPVTSIGNHAFAASTSLTSVTIPATVTSIGDHAFMNCFGLTGVYFMGDAPSAGYFVFEGLLSATVYYLGGTTGWGPVWPADAQGRPTMLIAIAVLTQPANQTVWLGWATTFTVEAAGTPPLNYQWSRDGTNLPGATLASLTLTNIQLADAGTYSVRATNAFGSTNSEPAILVVFSPETSPVKYVNLNNATPMAPFLTWATAATNIQDVIDVAADGETVLVTNGVYATGGRVVSGAVTNRVAVDKAVMVRSVNGPEVTVITGQMATRCVYLTNGAVLSGFTLTNGATRFGWQDPDWDVSGGGVWCESTNVLVTNCTLTGNYAYQGGGAYGGTLDNCTLTNNWTPYLSDAAGGGAYDCTLNNCTLADNFAYDYGGGAYNCTLNNCTLTDNNGYYGGGSCGGTLNNCLLTNNWSGRYGGGANGGTLNNCMLTGNVVRWDGGGANGGTLNNCTLTGNSAEMGGGAYGGTLNNCAIIGNLAYNSGGGYGGGAFASTLNNCLLTGNSADGLYSGGYGGGAAGGGPYRCTLSNCTLTENSAMDGGGAYGATLTNCILYYNTASNGGTNYSEVGYYPSTLNYCCTTPLPTTGVGNITNEPAFVDAATGNFRLQWYSACVNAGINQDWMLNATDLDGNPRIICGVVDMGAFEYQYSPPAVQALELLMAQVESTWPGSQPLIATLAAALASIKQGGHIAAINQLLTFQNQVRAQVLPSEPVLAASFIQAAQAIIDVLSGGNTNPGGQPRGRFTAARHQPNGRVLLQFSAELGPLYILEASTNFVDWERIGVAVDDCHGMFTFEDADAARFPNRVYRVVSP